MLQAWIEPPPGAGGADEPAAAGPRLSPMQWRLWWLATAGKLFEGLIVFLSGLVLPLVATRFGIGPGGQGLVSAATLAGILVGAPVLGGLADRFGRRPLFIGEMLLLALALLAAGCSRSAAELVVALFGVGLALGADYPTAHLMISENIPAHRRGRLVLAAFGFQALGAWLGTVLAALLLDRFGDVSSWRLFYLLPVIPVLLVAWGRLGLPESSAWLISRGRQRQAEQQLRRLPGRQDLEPAPAGDAPQLPPVARQSAAADWRLLFQDPLQRATILATVPWFLQDLSTYGIGIFTPLILVAASGAGAAGLPVGDRSSTAITAPIGAAGCAAAPAADPTAGAAALAAAAPYALASGTDQGISAWIHAEVMAARETILVDVGLLLGIVGAIALVDRCGRIPLQIFGFLGCALGLMAAAIASGNPQRPGLFLLALLLVQFMTNLGPNAQTYLLAGELFPTPLRGLGAGLAAAAGKLGAVLTAVLFPTLLNAWGVQPLLLLLVVTSLLGALITWCHRLESAGMPLESSAGGD
ncbi:MAG: MFS transporter [Synechococcus sp.]|nr:MFS transporter [Synechococcus sp.]